MSESRFSGSGTPIQALSPQQQQQQQPQQQMQQQQMYSPEQIEQMRQQQMQQMQQEQMQMHQMKPQQQKQHPQQQMQQMQQMQQEIPQDKFKECTGTSWQKFLAIIIVFILLNNTWIYDIEKNLLPLSLRIGNPPLIAVIINAILAGLLYLIISKIC